VNSGYWRRTTNSTQIVECIFEEACLGGYSVINEYPVECADGYGGNLCTKCTITNTDKYEHVNNYECQKCPNPILNAIRIVGLLFFVFGFVMFIIVLNIIKTKESELSVLLRIMTNYLQLITSSISLSTNYPSLILDMFGPVQGIGGLSEAFLSFD
jgi:hypothetical protein